MSGKNFSVDKGNFDFIGKVMVLPVVNNHWIGRDFVDVNPEKYLVPCSTGPVQSCSKLDFLI